MIRGGIASLVTAAVLAVVLPACANAPQRPVPPSEPRGLPEGDRPFAEGTPVEQARIREWIAALKTAKGEEALDLDRRLIAAGEPAVPALIAALADPDPALRGHAAYVLGYVKDRRALPALLAAASDPVPAVRYEAAASLLELKEPKGFAVLVSGLEDPDVRLRAKCAEVLAERTGGSLGFDPAGPPAERAAAVRRWRAWLAKKGL